jgi:type I restriction enzyme S subunit
MSEWKKVKIGDIATESKIPETNPDASKKIRVRLNVNGVEQRPLLAEKEGATKCYERKAGQFIYGRQNFHKGAFGIIPSSLDGFSSSSDLPAFDIDDSCLPEWLLYWFKTENRYKQLLKHAKGVASQRVSTSDFYSTEIPLPDTTTQQFIINGLQSTEQKTKELESLFLDQKTYLTILRQAILQEAIEGKLTADWRVNNPVCLGNPEYDAAALLKTIKTEKQKLIAEGKIKKEKPLAPINPDDVLFALPDGWVWCRLGNIISSANNGLYKPESFYSQDGTASLRMYNIQDGKISFNNVRRVNLTKDELKKYELQENDLLLNRVNSRELVGKTAIIKKYPENLVYESMNMRLRLVIPLIAEYINGYLLVSSVRHYFYNICKIASGQVSVNQEQVLSLIIPLPPLAEQNAIVERVDRLLATVNALEQQVQTRKTYAEQLMQAVLKEAFAA